MGNSFIFAGYPTLPDMITLRIGVESLHVCDVEASTVLLTIPYYAILCWGYTPSTFQWKVFKKFNPKASESAHSSTTPTATELTPSVEDVDTFVVITHQGVQIEAEVMATVRKLMTEMECKGIDDAEFSTFVKTLKSLTEEESDFGIQTIRQIAATRKFDARQALTLVNLIGDISPFDKLEAAIVLYEGVMNKESYLLVLNSFEDDGDRENICHRLGIAVTDTGEIVAVNAKAAGLL